LEPSRLQEAGDVPTRLDLGVVSVVVLLFLQALQRIERHDEQEDAESEGVPRMVDCVALSVFAVLANALLVLVSAAVVVLTGVGEVIWIRVC